MARYWELLRRQSAADKARIVAALTAGVRRMAELGIRHAHPQASDEEVRARLATRIYGREIACRFFTVPTDAS